MVRIWCSNVGLGQDAWILFNTVNITYCFCPTNWSALWILGKNRLIWNLVTCFHGGAFFTSLMNFGANYPKPGANVSSGDSNGPPRFTGNYKVGKKQSILPMNFVKEQMKFQCSQGHVYRLLAGSDLNIDKLCHFRVSTIIVPSLLVFLHSKDILVTFLFLVHC